MNIYYIVNGIIQNILSGDSDRETIIMFKYLLKAYNCPDDDKETVLNIKHFKTVYEGEEITIQMK